MISEAFQQFLIKNHLLGHFENLPPENMLWLEIVYLKYPEPEYRLFMFKMALHCIVTFEDKYKEIFSLIADFNVEQQRYMMSLFNNKLISLRVYHLLLLQLIKLGLWGQFDVEEFYRYSREKIQLLTNCIHILETFQLFDINIFRRLSLGMNESTLYDVHELLKQLASAGCLNSQILQGLFFPEVAPLTLQQMQCAVQIYIDLNSKNLNVDYLIPHFHQFATTTFLKACDFLMIFPDRVYTYPSFIIALMTVPSPEFFYENYQLLIELLDIHPEFDIADFYRENYEHIDLITMGLEYLRIFNCLNIDTFHWLVEQHVPDLSAHLFVLLHKHYTFSLDTITKALEFELPEALLLGIRILDNENIFQEYHLNLLIDSGFPQQFSEIIILCHRRFLDLQALMVALESKMMTLSLLEDFLLAADVLFDNNQLSLDNLLLILKTDSLEKAANLLVQAHDFDLNEELLIEFVAHPNPESRMKAHQYILDSASTTVKDWNEILDVSPHPLMTLYFWEMLNDNELLGGGIDVYIHTLMIHIFEYIYQKDKQLFDKELLSILIHIPETYLHTDLQFVAEAVLYLHQQHIYTWDNLSLLLNHPYRNNILFFLKTQLATDEEDYQNKVSLEYAEIFNDLNHELFWKRFNKEKLEFENIKLLLNTPLSNKKTIAYIKSTTHFLAQYIQDNKTWNTQLYNLMSQQLVLDLNYWLTKHLPENKAQQIIHVFKEVIKNDTLLFSDSSITIKEHLYYLLLLSAEMKISSYDFYMQLYQCLEPILMHAVEVKYINYRHFEPISLWIHNNYLLIDKHYHDIFYGYHYFRLAYANVTKKKVLSDEGKFEYFELIRLISTNQFEQIWGMIGSDVYAEFCKIYPQGGLNLYEYLRSNLSNFPIELDNKRVIDLICLSVFEEKCFKEHVSQNLQFFVTIKQEMMQHCARANKSMSNKELDQRVDAIFFLLIQVHPQFTCRNQNVVEPDAEPTYDLGCSSGR